MNRDIMLHSSELRATLNRLADEPLITKGPDNRILYDRMFNAYDDGRTKSGKHLIWWADARELRVVLTLGGMQRTLARKRADCSPATVTKFGRIADAATLYFWKYRRSRHSKEPSDTNMNFSVSQARADLANEPFLSEALAAYELELLKHKLVGAREESEPEVQLTTANRLRSLERQVAVLETQVAALTSRLNTLSDPRRPVIPIPECTYLRPQTTTAPPAQPEVYCESLRMGEGLADSL